MIIYKCQYEQYIIPGTILRRTIYNNHGHYTSSLEVTSLPYDDLTIGFPLKKFKYRAIVQPSNTRLSEREYFLNDLFNGKVEVLHWEPLTPFLAEDEMYI